MSGRWPPTAPECLDALSQPFDFGAVLETLSDQALADIRRVTTTPPNEVSDAVDRTNHDVLGHPGVIRAHPPAPSATTGGCPASNGSTAGNVNPAWPHLCSFDLAPRVRLEWRQGLSARACGTAASEVFDGTRSALFVCPVDGGLAVHFCVDGCAGGEELVDDREPFVDGCGA